MIRSKNIKEFPIHWAAFDEIIRNDKYENLSYRGDIGLVYTPEFMHKLKKFFYIRVKYGTFGVNILHNTIEVDCCFENNYPTIIFVIKRDIIYIDKQFPDKNAEILYDIDGIISEFDDEIVRFKSLLNGIDAEKMFVVDYDELIQDIIIKIEEQANVKTEFFANEIGYYR